MKKIYFFIAALLVIGLGIFLFFQEGKLPVNKNAEKSNLILGTNDIGFKYFVSKGATAESLMKMKYPVAKIRKEFNLQIEDFKDKKYSVND
jgi:hypothetical protein